MNEEVATVDQASNDWSVVSWFYNIYLVSCKYESLKQNIGNGKEIQRT